MVCRRVHASFSPEIVQAGAVKGLIQKLVFERGDMSFVTKCCLSSKAGLNAGVVIHQSVYHFLKRVFMWGWSFITKCTLISEAGVCTRVVFCH